MSIRSNGDNSDPEPFPSASEADARGRAAAAAMIAGYKAAGEPVPRIEYYPNFGILVSFDDGGEPRTGGDHDWPDPGSRDFLDG